MSNSIPSNIFSMKFCPISHNGNESRPCSWIRDKHSNAKHFTIVNHNIYIR